MSSLPRIQRGKFVAAILLLLALASACGTKGPAETSVAVAPVINGQDQAPLKEIITDENPGSPLQPQLIRIAGATLPMYEKPESDAKAIGQCPNNALVKYMFKRTNVVNEQFGKDLITGEWYLVRTDQPRSEGWIFAFKQSQSVGDPIGKNMEWIVGDVLQQQAINEDWKIAHLDRWSNEEIAQAIEIQGVPATAGPYSGYYCFQRSEEKVDLMNGPFHVVAQEGEEKIEIDGEYATGMAFADFVAIRTVGKVRETITLLYDGRSASCGGRNYIRSENGRQTREESDYNCSFDFGDFNR